MSRVFECKISVGLPIYEALVHEAEFGNRSDNLIEKGENGVVITVRTDDASALMGSVNYWLRLIKASSEVLQVI